MAEQYHGLPVRNLREVLRTLPLPDKERLLEGLSSKWRCVLCPTIAESQSVGDLHNTEEAVLPWVHNGMPVLLGEARAKDAHDAVGADALSYIQRDTWNTFPRPQIAVRREWGAPGTTLESPDYHKLIASFTEVFEHRPPAREVELTEEEQKNVAEQSASRADDEEADEVNRLEPPGPAVAAADGESPTTDTDLLELQVFHRQDPTISPGLPALGERLLWPSFIADGAECDVATSVSQRGCSRSWRLNDSGEFAFYAALPLPPNDEMPVGTTDQHRETCKLFIFGPHDSYDWFIHDDEALMRNKIVALDLFHTPDEALPVDATLLPILVVAPLQPGDAPLLVPPNLPYTTLAMRDCVVVEQRRLAHLWLDEVSYFLHHCSKWATSPIVYDYLERDLQDEQYLATQVIPLLMELFQVHHSGSDTPYSRVFKERVVRSLYSIAANEKHYGLSEASRRSLFEHLHTADGMREILEGPPIATVPGIDAPGSVEDALAQYWSLKRYWPQPGCVMRVPPLVPRRLLSRAAAASKEWYLPVMYAQCRPFYGTEQRTVQDTAKEYFSMKELENKRHPLLSLLRTRKSQKDELLDELF